MCMTLCKVRHACDPNARERFVEGAKVVYALKAIAAGPPKEREFLFDNLLVRIHVCAQSNRCRCVFWLCLTRTD